MRVLFSQKLIAISKPRCASTSLRKLLDPLVDPAFGDIAVDMAGEKPPYHPHHSAPYLKALLREDGYKIDDMETIIVTRHPLEMLWSYYKYFQPDVKSVYNYQQDKWDAERPMPFENWLVEGKVGMHPRAKEMAPEWIRTTNLSPLSLEAHILNRDGTSSVDKVFHVERLQEIADYIAARTGRRFLVQKTNSSRSEAIPAVGTEAIARVRELFPMECATYGV